MIDCFLFYEIIKQKVDVRRKGVNSIKDRKEVIMLISLNEVEAQYRAAIQHLINYEGHITATSLIEISDTLFKTVKIKNISNLDDEDSDMLLCQCGVYDIGNELGECFVLNITRQFIEPEEDEPYQLSIDLLYDPKLFEKIENLECWSFEFPDLKSYFQYIKSTDGFKLADELRPINYQIEFCQC